MLCLLVASCSASTDHAANSASSADPTAPAPSVEHAGRTVATVPEEGSAPATTGFDSASDGEDPSDEAEVAPGRRLAEVAPDESGRLWISFSSMSSQQVSVNWATAPDPGVVHQLHRVGVQPPSDGSDIEFEPSSLVFEAVTGPTRPLPTDRIRVDRDAGDGDRREMFLEPASVAEWDDTTVSPGETYFYVLASDRTGKLAVEAWREALVVDDTVAPDAPAGLSARVDGGTVSLSWAEAPDDVRFAHYEVARGDDGNEPTWIGTTWSLEQTAFIDDALTPEGTSAVFEVTALDFHGNRSLPARITVEF